MRRNSLEPALVGTPVSTTSPSPSPNPEPEQELLEKHPFSRKLHAKCLRVTMELLQQTINYRHPLYVDFFPDDVLTREFEKNLAEQATLYPCSQHYFLDHVTPVGNVGEGRPGGWERGVGVWGGWERRGGGLAGCCTCRARSRVPRDTRTTYYVLLLTWALAHFAHLTHSRSQPSRVCSRPSRTSCSSSGRTPRGPSSRPSGRRQTLAPRRGRRTLTVHEPPLGDVMVSVGAKREAHRGPHAPSRGTLCSRV